MYEPDLLIHEIFETYEEAYAAYELLSEEEKEIIATPRQSHNCWIFDKVK